MPWNISLTSSFLNTLLLLPEQTRKKFPYVLDILTNDPSPANSFSLKIKSLDLWRIRLTRQYRLFYKYQSNWITPIKISIRDDDTYEYEGLEKMAAEEIIAAMDNNDDDINIAELDPFVKDIGKISANKLSKCGIPSVYWPKIIELQDNQEQLLEYITKEVETKYQDRIIDIFCHVPLEEIDKQREYVGVNQQSIKDIIEKIVAGEISLADLSLKLSHEQQKILEINHNQPILVKGSAGTGKTVLAVHKVAQLAKRYHKEKNHRKILFTTYTRSLVNYSKHLLYPLLASQGLTDKYIEVYSLDHLALKYYGLEHNTTPLIVDKDISLLFINSVFNSININSAVKKKIKQLGGTEFILDEFIYFIEARGIEDLTRYQDIRHRLDSNTSQAVWEIYQNCKEVMAKSGYISIGQLRLEALKIVRQQEIKPYQSIIIDEAQDLSPVALGFLMALVSSPQDIFVTADLNQSLYQRHCGWHHIRKAVGNNLIEKELRTSFRNTEEIGKACYEILPRTDFYSSLKGDIPTVLLTDKLIVQAQYIKEFFASASQRFRLPFYSGVILSPDPNYGRLIAHQLSCNGLRAKYIQPEDININNEYIQILSLHSAKGLEFNLVAIVGLTEGVLPQISQVADNNLLLEDKQELIEQQRKLFYVGCSRAINSLLVCGSKANPSQFTAPLLSSKYWHLEEI